MWATLNVKLLFSNRQYNIEPILLLVVLFTQERSKVINIEKCENDIVLIMCLELSEEKLSVLTATGLDQCSFARCCNEVLGLGNHGTRCYDANCSFE